MPLAGQQDSGAMFTQLLGMEPTVDDMEKERQKILYNKVVKIESVRVETFDLGDRVQADNYAKIMAELYMGMQSRTHMILFNDRHFVTDGGKPRWIAHIEWISFELEVKSNEPVKSAQEEPAHGKGSTRKK